MNLPKLDIVFVPSDSDYRMTIHGIVFPFHSSVQVFVKSMQDGKWYKQAPVRMDLLGLYWSADICLGFPDSHGRQFQVAATMGRHIAENVLDELPSDVAVSARHTVTRRPKK